MNRFRPSSIVSVLFRALMLLLVLTMISTAGFADPRDLDPDELPLETAGGSPSGHPRVSDSIGDPLVVKSTASCHSSGKYCRGPFEEWIVWIRYLGDGEVQILLQPTAIASVSGYCTLFDGNRVLIPKDHPMIDRFLNVTAVARAMGDSFRIDWHQGPSGHCEVRQMYHPY